MDYFIRIAEKTMKTKEKSNPVKQTCFSEVE